MSNPCFCFVIHHGPQHAYRKGTLLVGMDQTNELDQWAGHSTGKHLKRHEFTDGNVLTDNQRGTIPDDNDGQ